MLRHWLGFLVLVFIFWTGTASMFHNTAAATVLAAIGLVLLAAFVIRGFLRFIWGVSGRGSSKTAKT